MRVGLFGGSFDPIHRGHVLPILDVVDEQGLDRVVYLPTASPPHKDREMAPAWLRYAMVELALLEHSDLTVSTFELGSPAGSEGGTAGGESKLEAARTYTIDTVEFFQNAHPDWHLFLIVGADSWSRLNTWRRSADLLSKVEVIVLPRAGSDRPTGSDDRPDMVAAIAAGRVLFSKATPVDASSSHFRSRWSAGSARSPPVLRSTAISIVRAGSGA